MVLEAITQQRFSGWASLASVCKEWQVVIEKRNFYHLKLNLSCLDDFRRMVIRQRDLVYHIQLDLGLQRRYYTYRSYRQEESDSSRTSWNDIIIRDGIWKLFSILSTWKSAKNGLVLQLNAYPPSDSEPDFKDFYFSSNSGGDEKAMRYLQEIDKIGSGWHGPKHGCINSQRVQTSLDMDLPRFFEFMSRSFSEGLPHIDIVTDFMISQELYFWLLSQAMLLILNKIHRLEQEQALFITAYNLAAISNEGNFV